VEAVLLDGAAAGAVTPAGDELTSLVPLAQAGDRRAVEDLLRASYDRVYPVCRRIVGNGPDAADAAQEALISVVRGLGRFDGRSRYSTWLYRIAVNASIDELRRRRRRPLLALPSTDDGSAPPEPEVADGGPEEVVGRLDIESALLDLPLDFRAAVVLRDVCGLDYAEIAEVLSLPGGTVRSRIARGRSLLAGRLGAAREETT
jgi:RNA polymerase sigma-70 factor (ECF subfamily)